MELKLNDPWSEFFRPGTVLLRDVVFSPGGEARLNDDEGEDWIYDIRSDGVRVARLRPVGNYLFEPEILPPTLRGRPTNGIVCMVNGDISKLWTHVIVTGVGRAFHAPGSQRNGGVVYAAAVSPWPMENYLFFRERMYSALRLSARLPFADQVRIAGEIPFPEVRAGERRLISDWQVEKGDGFYCRYEVVGSPVTASGGLGESREAARR